MLACIARPCVGRPRASGRPSATPRPTRNAPVLAGRGRPAFPDHRAVALPRVGPTGEKDPGQARQRSHARARGDEDGIRNDKSLLLGGGARDMRHPVPLTPSPTRWPSQQEGRTGRPGWVIMHTPFAHVKGHQRERGEARRGIPGRSPAQVGERPGGPEGLGARREGIGAIPRVPDPWKYGSGSSGTRLGGRGGRDRGTRRGAGPPPEVRQDWLDHLRPVDERADPHGAPARGAKVGIRFIALPGSGGPALTQIPRWPGKGDLDEPGRRILWGACLGPPPLPPTGVTDWNGRPEAVQIPASIARRPMPIAGGRAWG